MRAMRRLWALGLALVGSVGLALAQEPAEQPAAEPASPVAESVEVEPAVSDESIAERLTRILGATGWFAQVDVRVDQGIVFLNGRTDSVERKSWAADLAQSTQGVVAVVNDMAVEEAPLWDLSPVAVEMRELASYGLRRSPLILLGLLVLLLTWLATAWSSKAARSVLGPRLNNALLRTVASRVIAVPVLLLGFYLALRIAGLTGLAVTVLGGTGLIGLMIGVAFRDIAENFLASLMISMQNPFASGDLIAVAGHTGIVQSVNTRSTLLMTLEGNHVQIPNATIYKETITNFTANPNTRFDFSIGIGVESSIEQAQTLARSVLSDQEGVVATPESWVVVESLGSATVNLRIYFWVDARRYNGLKIRSAVIRGVKKAYDEAGISMPDEAREVVFPAGVPVRMVEAATPAEEPPRAVPVPAVETDLTEGDLTSEAVEIEHQAEQARKPEGGPNLLKE